MQFVFLNDIDRRLKMDNKFYFSATTTDDIRVTAEYSRRLVTVGQTAKFL